MDQNRVQRGAVEQWHFSGVNSSSGCQHPRAAKAALNLGCSRCCAAAPRCSARTPSCARYVPVLGTAVEGRGFALLLPPHLLRVSQGAKTRTLAAPDGPRGQARPARSRQLCHPGL